MQMQIFELVKDSAVRCIHMFVRGHRRLRRKWLETGKTSKHELQRDRFAAKTGME